MKKREITTTGTIDAQGNLKMYMEDINEFFRMHPGKRVTVQFKVYDPGTSQALRGYYYNCVVPTIRQALWENGERKTIEQTDTFVREISPIMWREEIDPDTGKTKAVLKRFAELSNAELIEHIETLKQIAAEEYNTYIADPNEI